MSYLVLARKYRPRTFSEVIGQEHITRTLKNAIKLNKISHAYLFSGQRGVGKTTTARILAKAVNCKNSSGSEPCGKCDICREIDRSSSVDIIEIDAASNRGIDEIRQLRENIKFAPAKCKYKIYIIDEVHMLTTQAFNAILKSLEEPPPHVIFIMATTEPDKVLETITSRCQTFNFKPISEEMIIDALEGIAEKEEADYEEEGLRMIARAAGGSMRDAQSIMDQALSYGDGKITASQAADMLGIVPGKFLFELSEYIKNETPAEALKFSAQLYTDGYSPNRLHRDLLNHFRNLMMAKVFKKDNEALGLGKNYCARLQETAEGFKDQRLLWITDYLEKNTFRLKHSETPRVVMDTIIFKLCERFVSFEDLMKFAKSSDSSAPELARQETVPQPEKTESRQHPQEADLKKPKKGGKWNRILRLIKRESQPLYHTLKNARAALKGNTVVIRYSSLLEIKGKKEEVLREKIKQILGEEFTFTLKKTAEQKEKKTDSAINTTPSSRRFNPIEIEEQEPVVAQIVEQFNGQIEEQYKREK